MCFFGFQVAKVQFFLGGGRGNNCQISLLSLACSKKWEGCFIFFTFISYLESSLAKPSDCHFRYITKMGEGGGVLESGVFMEAGGG
jgi:hypothetical protein